MCAWGPHQTPRGFPRGSTPDVAAVAAMKSESSRLLLLLRRFESGEKTLFLLRSGCAFFDPDHSRRSVEVGRDRHLAGKKKEKTKGAENGE